MSEPESDPVREFYRTFFDGFICALWCVGLVILLAVAAWRVLQ